MKNKNESTPTSSDLLEIISNAATNLRKERALLKKEILEEIREEKERQDKKQLELILKNPGLSA